MTDFAHRIRPDWPNTLEAVLARAAALGPKGVLAFDLDSTLFDNRPRQARILREFAEARGVAELLQCAAVHFDSGWDMKAVLRNCGMPPERIEALYPEVKKFWVERFFTSPYCLDDLPIDGGAEFCARVLATGAVLAYVTGRHEAMREGSEGSMRQHGLPVPDGERIHLIMKPSFDVSDDDFKREAHAKLNALGTLVAAFDNEPTHANDYLRKFPEAQVIHLATDHSGRPVELLEDVVSVPHFRYA